MDAEVGVSRGDLVEAAAVIAVPCSPTRPPLSFPAFLTGLLESVLSGCNGIPCPLPSDFCRALLLHDSGLSEDEDQGELFRAEGVPKYPHYKHIAHGLSKWILTQMFPRTVEPMEGIAEDESKATKIENWTQIVTDLGISLQEVFHQVNIQLHCQEPYFSQLKDGIKTVEGRCASCSYNSLQAGVGLLFNGTLLLKVKDVKRYNYFKEMLESEGLSCVLPGVTTIADGVQVYRKFYTEEQETHLGVLGIHVQEPMNMRQPFQLMYDLLKDLHIDGVRALLGMRSTLGSIADALPPPTSLLFSSFSAINNETVPGSKLTVGARALAKHVHRCRSGWWGKFTGTEAEKNKLSLLKLGTMIDGAVWMNTHVVPVLVFEIRLGPGYGARWTHDGSQFRGFLEPPMDEGYLHRWRH